MSIGAATKCLAADCEHHIAATGSERRRVIAPVQPADVQHLFLPVAAPNQDGEVVSCVRERALS